MSSLNPATSDRPVVVLTTGGTIDKVYSVSGELITGSPAVAHLLQSARVAGRFDIIEVLAKDSLDMTDEDRAAIAARVAGLRDTGVVVTHGTDTMTHSAEFLRDRLDPAAGVTVVFTGAMQPAAMQVTDSPFNLGAAVTAAQLLPPGVYIAMSGQVFRAGHVRKDLAIGHFVAV